MKKALALFVVASVVSSVASAQMRERPRHECLRVCMIVAPTPHKGRHEEQLAKIRENIKNETDIRKLNQLAEDEKTLIEKHQDTIDNTCHKICDQNPVQ